MNRTLIKYLITFSYIILIAVFGFFYEDKAELKAMNMKYSLSKSMDDYYDVDMPRYEGVKEFPISGEQYVNNARVQSSYFLTEDTPLTIASFYKKYWESQGLKINSDINPESASLSVYDYNDGVVKTVMIQHERGKLNRVILSSVNSNFMKREFNSFSDLPIYKNSYGFVSYELEDPNYHSAVVSYRNNDSIERNISFYKTSLLRTGWKKENELQKKGTTLLIFTKGNKEVTLTLTPVKKATALSVVVKNKR